MTTTCSTLHPAPQRTARVARSYWRCSECGATHAVDVLTCTSCGGPDAFRPVPRRGLQWRHWLALLGAWAAATLLWAAASGLLAGAA